MKREIIAIGLMTVIICASGCQKENQSEGNVIVPVVKSISTATKASLSDDAEQLLFSAPVKSDAGEEYTLEAWISDTESGMPETKGAPIDNVTELKDVYGTFKTTAYCNATHSYDIYSSMQNATAFYDSNSGSWSYDKTYKWPAAEYCPLTFCSYAPADASISSLSLASGPAASFTYTASDTDLLFAMDTHDRGTKGEIDIHFHHALTSVKFTRGDISDCTISTISLVNFYGTGVATYNGSRWTWTPSGTANTTYTHTFNRDVNNVTAATGATDSGGSLDPNSDESLTFMVIPQNLSGNSAKIKITLSDNSEITYDLSGSDNDAIKNWSTYAGKTVTFKVNKKDPMFDVVIVMDSSTSMLSDCSNTDWTDRTKVTDYTKRMVVQRYAVLKLLKEIKQPGVNVSLISFCNEYDSKIKISNNAVSNWTIPESGFAYTNGSEKIFTKTVVLNHLTDITSVYDDMTELLEYSKFKAAGSSYKGSCPYLGLQLAYYELSVKSTRNGAKKKVIFISDGYPTTKYNGLQYSGDDGAGSNTGTYYRFNDSSNNVVTIANYTIDAGTGVEQTYNYGNNFYYTAKQIKNLASTEIYTLFTGSGSFATGSDAKYSNCRQFLSAISSDKPDATSYTNGESTLNSTVTSGKYAYTLNGQNLDTFMPELAKIILK